MNDVIKKTIIVVGAGPVGLRFVEESLSLQPYQQIKLFAGEAFKPYDRVKLSQLLARDIPLQEIYNQVPNNEQVIYFDNCPIVEINRNNKSVLDSEGRWHSYSKLILALGSSPFIPNIPNIEIKNVFTFRDLKDTEALLARNIASRHTIIVGGGLLGLETARAMLRNSTKITLIQLGKHLMDRQLDLGAASILEKSVQALGMDVICSTRVAEIKIDSNNLNTRRAQVGGVILDNDQEISCDTVVISAGIKPRIELARKHGLAVGKGIQVNKHLQTSDANIYAIGECAQFGDEIYGLVAPGWEHASIAAHHINGEEAIYKGTINAATLKVVGEEVFSVGEVNPEVGRSIKSTVYKKNALGLHRSVFTINNRLVGALAIGSWSEQNRIRVSINEGRKVYFWNQWLFKLTGSLWLNYGVEDINTWPASMVVCNCTGVTQRQLCTAKSSGANTLDTLVELTRASTVCGSCKPLLAQFVGSEVTLSPSNSLLWLKRLSLVTVLVLLALFLVTPIPFSASVQKFSIDQLWLNNFYKQISGFSILGLAGISLLMSLSKRANWFNLGKFTSWRIVHTVLGFTAIGVLLAHTGFNLGSNFNKWLMIDFLLLIFAGGLAGVIISNETNFPAQLIKKTRSYLTWAHTLFFWPLPSLLAFHILTAYYF